MYPLFALLFILCSCGLELTITEQADGAIVVKTTQAVLVAEYSAPTQAPEAALVVEGLGDYLKSVGY